MEQPRFSVVANGVTTFYSSQEQIVEDLDRITRQVKMGQMNAQELHVDYKSMSFFEFFESRTNERIMKRTTRLRFVSTLNLLRSEAPYLEHFEDLTPEKLCRFDEYLRRRKAHGSHLMADTSIAKIHNTIKTIIREAIVRKIITANPYECLHIVKGRCKERVFLTRDELDRFIAYQPESQERREVKDCFLVSCYTGLAYVDLFNVDFTKRKQVQGHWLVYNHRQKTNERNTIVLLPIVLDILKKYDFKLPHRSNVGYNRQLSILCKEMDLGKKLTTHCARHTFATTVCLGSGIPIQVVQRMLGHSNIHTTEIYTHMTETDLIGGYDMIK